MSELFNFSFLNGVFRPFKTPTSINFALKTFYTVSGSPIYKISLLYAAYLYDID